MAWSCEKSNSLANTKYQEVKKQRKKIPGYFKRSLGKKKKVHLDKEIRGNQTVSSNS